MKTKLPFLSRLFLLFVLLIIANFAYSQGDSNTDNHTITVTIPEVALLDIETNSTKNFTAAFTHSGEAGDPVTAPADNSTLWLNYSSILKSGGATSRDISVAMTGGPLGGVTIKVSASAAASGGQGTLGGAGGPITLSATSTPLITGIGSAYTVSGPEKGHQLTYTFEAADDDYANLVSGSSSNVVTVTYTLADN